MAVRIRLRHTLAAAVLAVPLVVAPALAPTAAAALGPASARDLYGYGVRPGAPGAWGQPSGRPWRTAVADVDSQPATATESTGVVLVRTQVGYGTGEAAGTGLVLDADGVVVTNHHVVQGATSVTVAVPGTGRSYTADVLGYDVRHDVAVLRLRGAAGLATVRIDSAATTVGEQVTAVGNAGGTGTLTAADGAVTDARTAITVEEDDGSAARLRGLIEVDADIVSGDSGGALLDADNEVVGMNVAASSGTADISGYAIPIGRVLSIAGRVLAGDDRGPVVLGYEAALGVSLHGDGVPVVAGTVDRGAAAVAGITPGSTLTALDGTAVETLTDLTRVLARHRPGDTVTAAWTDAAGAGHSARVSLGRAPLA